MDGRGLFDADGRGHRTIGDAPTAHATAPDGSDFYRGMFLSRIFVPRDITQHGRGGGIHIAHASRTTAYIHTPPRRWPHDRTSTAARILSSVVPGAKLSLCAQRPRFNRRCAPPCSPPTRRGCPRTVSLDTRHTTHTHRAAFPLVPPVGVPLPHPRGYRSATRALQRYHDGGTRETRARAPPHLPRHPHLTPRAARAIARFPPPPCPPSLLPSVICPHAHSASSFSRRGRPRRRRPPPTATALHDRAAAAAPRRAAT